MTPPSDRHNGQPDTAISEAALTATVADVEMLVGQLEARLDDRDHVLVHRLRLAAQTLGVANAAWEAQQHSDI